MPPRVDPVKLQFARTGCAVFPAAKGRLLAPVTALLKDSLSMRARCANSASAAPTTCVSCAATYKRTTGRQRSRMFRVIIAAGKFQCGVTGNYADPWLARTFYDLGADPEMKIAVHSVLALRHHDATRRNNLSAALLAVFSLFGFIQRAARSSQCSISAKPTT